MKSETNHKHIVKYLTILFAILLVMPMVSAADRYWVGGTGTWSDDTNHWATSSGGAPGAGNLPTIVDNVYFDVLSHTGSYTVTISATANAQNMTWANPLTGSPTLAGASILNLNGSLTLVSGMGYTYTGTATFVGSGNQYITTASNTLTSVFSYQSTSGNYTWLDNQNLGTRYTSHDKGIVNTNNFNYSANAWYSNNAFTRTLNMGSSTFNIITDFNIRNAYDPTLTFNAGTSNIIYSGTALSTFTGINLTFYNVLFRTSGTASCGNSLGGMNTFNNLTIFGGNSVSSVCTLTGNMTVKDTLNITSFSNSTRILVKSDTLDVKRTINASSVITSNIDFQDIYGTGSTDWNISNMNSGDCGGNNGITFTPPQTNYWNQSASGSTNWATDARWFLGSGGTGGKGRIPLCQDTAIFDNNSFYPGYTNTIVQNMARIGSMNWTGVKNSPVFTTSTATSFFGDFILDQNVTLTASTQTYTYEGRTAHVLSMAGKIFEKPLIIDAVNGTLNLGDNLNLGTSRLLTLTRGNLSSGIYNVSVGAFASSGSISRGLFLGSGTWTLTGITNPVWNLATATNMNLIPSTSTIKINDSSSSTKTFNGGGKTYNNLYLTGSGTGTFDFIGNNTFNDFKVDTPPHTIRFTAGSLTNVSTFTVSGNSSANMTITSITSANHSLNKYGSGIINSNYLNVSYSQASPASTWYAGANSFDGGNNSGWLFETAEMVIVTALFPASDGQLFNYHIPVNFSESTTIGSLDSCWWTIDNGTTNTTITCGDNITGQTWNQGLNTITLYANNTNNTMGSATRTFNIDTINPNATLLSPNNGTITNIVSNNYTVNVTDNIGINNVTLSIWDQIGLVYSNSISFGAGVLNAIVGFVTSLADGIYNWGYTVTDNANNTYTTDNYTITIDTISPNIAITYPVSGAYYGYVVTALNYTVSDLHLGACWYSTDNGATNITVTCGNNVTGLSANEGSNTWRVYNNDTAGNVNSTSSTFTVDTINPQISYGIGTENDGANVSQSNVYINVSVTEANEANITFNLYNDVVDTVCYQETANASTVGDGDCGLNYTGRYYSAEQVYFTDYAKMFDGDWNTFGYNGLGDSIISWYINYTKPMYANNATWQIKSGPIENPPFSYPINITIPSDCWNYNSQKLILRADLSVSGGQTVLNSSFYCYNSTWNKVYQNDSNAKGIYEEAMIWNVSKIVNSTTYLTPQRTINFTNLPDGGYSYNVTVVDIVSNSNTTETRTINLDTTKPLVQFVSPTETSGSYISRDNILINTTSTDTNLANITIYIYNSTDLINSTTTITSPNYINLTGLTDGIYYFNATVTDFMNNQNSTETRNVTIDTINPSLTISFPQPINYTVKPTSLNATTSDVNLASCWYSLDNGATNITYTCNTNITSILANEGSNTWTVYANDSANNQNSTSVTFFIDAITPTIDFVSPTETSGSYISRDNILINTTSTDTNLANITIYIYNSTDLINSTTTITSPNYINFTSLADGIYYFNATSEDAYGNSNSTETRNITIDTTNPQIQFVSPTQNDGVNLSQNSIVANISITETNFANITFNLYNLTSLVNTTTYQTATTLINWTSLPSTDYSYNVSTIDLAGNENSTETRTIRLDCISPNATLISPENNTYSNVSLQNFTVNISDNLGIENATLNVYNSTDLVNQTTVDYGGGIINSILGIAVYLIDGVYHWFYEVIDTAGNVFTTDNRTITIDTSASSLGFVNPTESNNAYINYPNLLINVSSSDINNANITINAYNNSDYLINSSTSSSNLYFVNITGLEVNKRYKFNATSTDLAGNENSTETISLRIDDAGTTITNSTVDDNVGEYSIIFNSNISFSTINISTINSSVISYSTVINSLYTVINSTVINSTIDNSTVINSNITNSTINNSVISNSTLINVTSDNCTMSNLVLSDLVCLNNIIFGTIQFTSPTTVSGNYSQSSITANVTATSFANITINLYDSNGLINSTTSVSSPFYLNFTSLPNEAYYLNATRTDALGNQNSTETRSFILDTTSPIIHLLSPSNSSDLSYNEVNFTCAMDEVNPSNMTLNVWNSSGSLQYNETKTYPETVNGCYQETANISTSCGGLNTGEYALWTISGSTSDLIDGNWSTHRYNSNISVNYTKPYGYTTNSLWQVKDADQIERNLTIPLSCWQADEEKLMLRMITSGSGLQFYAESECYDGSSWVNLQHLDVEEERNDIYEEAMNWEISSVSYGPINLSDSNDYEWNCLGKDTLSNSAWAESNYTFSIDTSSPVISILSPIGNLGIQSLPFNATLNYSATDINLDSCWYNSTINSTITPVTCNTLQQIDVPNVDINNLYVYANDTSGNVAYNSTTFYISIIDNGVTYTSPVISGDSNTIIGNFSIVESPVSATLTYNNVNYTPSISVNGDEYILTSNVIAPNVDNSTNISFYYTIVTTIESSTSVARNQTVNPLILNVSSDCSSGFLFMNITNYDETTLIPMNGTVEYDISMLNNLLQISHANGTATGQSIQVCSNLNLSASSALLNLQLRYYADGYMYETYNIQNGNSSYIPYLISLYYLNNSIGTQFQINYVDFEYITHPDAMIQIQRQYLADNTYKIVELPVISSDGASQASFDTHNVRYKLIVTEDGEIIDIFDEVFPLCQNIILGTCTLDLRGEETPETYTSGDFTYTITASNNTATLTYIIPSGTPRSVTFSTVQNSRFLDNLSTCNTTQFASGGTIICGYNSTVGDSIVDTQIDVTGQPSLYGTIGVAEDLSTFFLGNNYVIAFFMLLSLVLMFIGSAMAMLVVAAIGIVYLSVIFLIKGGGVGFIVASMAWLLIAIGLAVYKISQKEERS